MIPLNKHLQAGRPDWPVFFSMAIQLVGILEKFHRKGIVRGLKPDDIFLHPGTVRVKIAADAAAVNQLLFGGDGWCSGCGTENPAYMSPEQFGPNNAEIDYRSDYYSLGVVLYEILTGQLPFRANNLPMWAHAHMAKQPADPATIQSGIPRVISAIIMKLLAKSADARYRSASGLRADLEECWRQWSRTGTIKLFNLGRADICGWLTLPDKLYGRQEEAAVLRAAFSRVCSGQRGLLLVHGDTGTGKTALVNKILRPLAAGRGYFITGHCPEIQRENNPYIPFIKAMRNLLQQLLTESPDSFLFWQAKLFPALNRSGAVIIKFVPEAELFIGTRQFAEIPRMQELSHLCMVLRKVFREIARERPLIVFLDDLQWADQASLSLMRQLSEDEQNMHLLLIGACRNNGITGAHALLSGTGKEQKAGTLIECLPLGVLSPKDTGQFVAEALHCSEAQVKLLAEILYRRSGGIPASLVQLLEMVQAKKILHFNAQQGCLEWDAASLEDITATKVKKDIKSAAVTPKHGPLARGGFFGAVLLGAVQKTVEALSAELSPELLLNSILDIAMEASGADKGYVIMLKDQELYAEAAKDVNAHTVPGISPLQKISWPIVRYALRSLAPVILDDARQAGLFATDPYLAQGYAKSVVCLPLVFRGVPRGVLYLENSFMTGIFASDRVDVLKLLAAQLIYAQHLQASAASVTARAPGHTHPPLIETLTEREGEVLRLIAEGLSNQEIAAELKLTVSTVKTHIFNIYGKLRVNRRVQAVTRAKELRLLKLHY